MHVGQPFCERDALVHEPLALDGVRAPHGLGLGAEARDLFAQRTQLAELLPGGRELGGGILVGPELLELVVRIAFSWFAVSETSARSTNW